MSSQERFQYTSTVFFFIALIHTFLSGKLTSYSHKFKNGSIQKNFLHLFGEVESIWLLVSSICIGEYSFNRF
ncbi:MAG: putative Na+/H+ antiporter [Bacteriovorax sp.]